MHMPAYRLTIHVISQTVMANPSRRLGLNSHKPREKICKSNGQIRINEAKDRDVTSEITSYRQIPVVVVQQRNAFI